MTGSVQNCVSLLSEFSPWQLNSYYDLWVSSLPHYAACSRTTLNSLVIIIHCVHKEASRFFFNIFGKFKATIIILAGRCSTLLGHQLYKVFPPHSFRFAALPCEITLCKNFSFFVIQDSRKKQPNYNMKFSPICKFVNCQLMPVRSGVWSVHHLHEHMLWDNDATGVLLWLWLSTPS